MLVLQQFLSPDMTPGGVVCSRWEREKIIYINNNIAKYNFVRKILLKIGIG
jgi:hypothetical protein